MPSIYWNFQEMNCLPENLTWLSENERLFLSKLRFPKRHQEWLLGRWTAKNLMIKVHPLCNAIKPDNISIHKSENGSPFVTLNEKKLKGILSITHRESLAVTAWCDQPQIKIGIDLEAIEPKEDSFINDFFTTIEVNQVAAVPLNQKGLTASLIWSAKEAVLKAYQTGLSLDTRKVEIDIESHEINQGWQVIPILHCPEPYLHQTVLWKPLNNQLMTLAILSNEITLPEISVIEV